MKIIILIVLGLLLIYSYKKPHITGMIFCLVVSLSPLIKGLIGDNGYNFLIIEILLLLLIRVIKDGIFKRNLIVYFSIVLVCLLLQIFIVGIYTEQVILSIHRYIYIPIVALYSIKYMVEKNIRLSMVYTPYFIINLGILYYRALIDYTFFGVMRDENILIFEDVVKMGSVFYRPSNFNSPIVFSIELVMYLCLLFLESNKNKIFYIMVALSAFPLLVMQSRSSYIIILLFVIIYCLLEKKFIILTGLILAVISLGVTFGDKIYLFTVFDLQEKSYTGRIDSIMNTISKFQNEDWYVILFGRGVGSANLNLGALDNNYGGIYVENFFMSLLFDSGIIVFSMWLIFNVVLLVVAFSKKSLLSRYSFIIIICLLVTNLLASNLTAYVIQSFYWNLVFIIIYNNKITIKSKIKH